MRAAAVLLSIALAGAGCGGGSPSKADFAARADALCTQANRSVPQTPPRTVQDAVRYTQQQAAARTSLDARLRRLRVPDSERSDFAAYGADTRTMIDLLAQQNAAARRSDESGYYGLQQRFE
ncbi:MAG: hypothetical protein JOZ25_10935, partial [Actinobacteria bacterium]|nr:hypothetical protein [Actinomycetota bacterium]